MRAHFPGHSLKYLTSLNPLTSITQIFHRLSSSTPLQDPDSRFDFFTKTVIPTYILTTRSPSRGILIFIPNPFDFLRVRNFFAHTLSPISFSSISEHTHPSEVARAHFANGRYRVLLYSGRVYFYRRYVIKRAREVRFDGVPEELGAYEKVGGFLATADEESKGVNKKVATVFSKWEGLALERVAGLWFRRGGEMFLNFCRGWKGY